MRASIFRPASALALLATLGLLTGCLEDLGVTRFTAIPTAVPPHAEFRDRNPGELIGGKLTITPADDGQVDTDKWTFDAYVVQWAIDGTVIPRDIFSASNVVGRVDRTAVPLELTIYHYPPNGANSMVVSTANALGIAQQGQVVYFENLEVDPRVPSILAKPKSVSFTDKIRKVTIGNANVSFSKPTAYNKCDDNGCVQITNTEEDIAAYVIRYADSQGCPLVTNEIGRINQASGTYYFPVGANGVVVYPPSHARSIAVIPANEYGEAYSENCADYAHSSPSTFNDIWPSRNPHFGPENVYLTPDEDSTEAYTGYLVIKPSKDERDLLSGYYVTQGVTTSSAMNTFYRYIEKEAPRSSDGDHRIRLEKYMPPALGDGSRPPMNNMIFYVSAGDQYVSGNLAKSAKLVDAHSIGNWYLINEEHELADRTSDYCIKADALNSKIYKAKCDKYDVQQRFIVDNAGLTNNDVHYIKSMAFDNACIFRQDDAGAPNWELRTCNNDWNTRIEIKAHDQHNKDDIHNKKIAVNHDAGWTCLAHYSVTDDLSSPWGNCGIITAQIYWRFLRAGTSGDFGLFNDPYVPK